MSNVKLFMLLSVVVLIGATDANPSAVDVLQDIYRSCFRNLDFSCAKHKALKWMSEIGEDDEINITEDLVVVKKNTTTTLEENRRLDVFEKFEEFLQTHDLIAKPPSILQPDGPLGDLVPRSFQPEKLKVPLASSGRSSKLIKRMVVPFLLGLKFKTAVLVPLALALIALKSWKAVTLGLLSLVLTGAIVLFKITKPKVVNYEVIHYPQHVDHHVEHVDHPPAEHGWDNHGYGRGLKGSDLAYRAHRK